MFLLWSCCVAFDAYPDDQSGVRLLLISVLIAGIAVLQSHREGQWSLPFLSFIALFLFHIGLFFSVAFFSETPQFLIESDSQWFISSPLGMLSAYIALSFTSFTLGLTLPTLGRTNDSSTPAVQTHGARVQRDSFSNVGSVVLTLSVFAWFAVNIRANGPLFFLGTYREYLDSVQDSLIGLTFMGIGLGLTMTVQWTRGWLSRMALASFVLFALAGFPLGLRGEVLMPAVAAAAVLMKFAPKRPKWALLIGSIIVLVLITLGKQVRQIGLAGATESEFSFRILDAVEEMGASLRVLATSVGWHEEGKEPFALGATYVTPVIRNFNSIFGIDNLPTDSDFGLFNVEIAQRVGNIGGSLIGEAHHNFGVAGLVVIPLMWGVLISVVNISARTPLQVAVLGLVGMLFLMHVRNASTPLFMWLVAGIAMVWIAARLGTAHGPKILHRKAPRA